MTFDEVKNLKIGDLIFFTSSHFVRIAMYINSSKPDWSEEWIVIKVLQGGKCNKWVLNINHVKDLEKIA